MIKRSIKLNGLDKELNLSKASSVRKLQDGKEFIYLDKLTDGTWRMVWTEQTIPDMTKVTSFEIVRK